jgi:hypothetical protein
MKDDQFRHFLLSDLFGIQAQVTLPFHQPVPDNSATFQAPFDPE